MLRIIQTNWCWAGMILCVGLCGCSGASDVPELAYVEGTITVDGEPTAGLLVLFGPDEGRTSTGYTDEEGHYTLTYLPGQEGAKVGKHKVVITTGYEPEEEEEEQAFTEPIPPQYNTQSTLSAEVVPGQDNTFDFELQTQR